jgi:hypothetical protein
MATKKKRNKKYVPPKIELEHDGITPLIEDKRSKFLRRVANLNPKSKNATSPKGKQSDTQNLRRGNR